MRSLAPGAKASKPSIGRVASWGWRRASRRHRRRSASRGSRTIVVLPAALGPSSAKMVPASTSTSMPSSTRWSPNDLRRPVAEIAGRIGVIGSSSARRCWEAGSRRRRRTCEIAHLDGLGRRLRGVGRRRARCAPSRRWHSRRARRRRPRGWRPRGQPGGKPGVDQIVPDPLPRPVKMIYPAPG